MTSLGTAGSSRRTQLLGVTIKYSLCYFGQKISVVISLWWLRLCEIILWALGRCPVLSDCCSLESAQYRYTLFVGIIPQSTFPIQITCVGLKIGRMCACYLLVYYRFLHENRDDIFKTHSRIHYCVTSDLKP
jgi:hypothetical protein